MILRLLIALFVMLGACHSFAAKAPPFTAQTLDGDAISLPELVRKDRYLLLCFWASWCEPCLDELKTLKERFSGNASLPLDVVTINVDSPETQNMVRPTTRLYSIPFRVVLDPKREILHQYQNSELIPYSVLVDGQGEVKDVFQGLSEGHFAKILKAVKPEIHKDASQLIETRQATKHVIDEQPRKEDPPIRRE